MRMIDLLDPVNWACKINCKKLYYSLNNIPYSVIISLYGVFVNSAIDSKVGTLVEK